MNVPNSPESEKMVLSCMMQGDSQEVLANEITEDHFYEPHHKNLFNLLFRIHTDSEEFDLVKLGQRIGATNEYEYGTVSFVTEVFSYSCSSSMLLNHIRILKKTIVSREGFIKATKLATMASDPDSSPEDIVNAVRDASDALSTKLEGSSKAHDSKASCKLFLDDFQLKHSRGGLSDIPTGVTQIDDITGGFNKQDLWCISGYPSTGKSVLMMQLVHKALLDGKKVLVFSLEMSTQQIIGRLISSMMKVHMGCITKPNEATPKKTLDKIRRGIEGIMGLSLEIVDEGGQSIESIESIAMKQNTSQGVDMVVVDYWQLIECKGIDDETKRQNKTSFRLKQLAKRLDCPVVTASQLNDDGKTKYSRKITEDSNVCLRIVSGDSPAIIVDKNRDGERGVAIPMVMHGEIQKFI